MTPDSVVSKVSQLLKDEGRQEGADDVGQSLHPVQAGQAVSSFLRLGHGGAVAVDAKVVDGAAAEEGGDAVQVEELERQSFNEGVVDDVEKSSAISETIINILITHAD